MSTLGARIAFLVGWRGISMLVCALASGCLVTDQVQLDPAPTTPPIVLAADIPLGSVITFNATQSNQLTIPVRVRDDNIQETLKARFRIVTNTKTGTYACPEPPIPSNNELIRDESQTQIAIESTAIDRGAFSRIEYVVSANFLSCEKHPDVFDVTTSDNDDVGRAVFWILETSTEPLTDGMAARTLLSTCPAVAAPKPPPTSPTMATP